MAEPNIIQKEEITRAVLIAVSLGREDAECENSLAELERLLDTAGGEVAATVIQNRPHPDKATYIGSGKCEEVAELVKADPTITLAVFDNELSPSQIAAVEEIVGIRVIDRTMLILDIFALHAVTGEGKLQVEIACLRYTAPRLVGKGKMLSRQGGGIGSRGPGESKLESDRRHIRRRIEALEAELDELERTRGIKRSQRMRSGLATVAIIGYTNAGKSTLLNRLTDAGILAEDKLFATLDPTTRRLTLPGGTEVLLTDTVGFIDRLPTHLVRAFRSTLEELTYCDVILCLTDGSEEAGERTRKRAVTEKLIGELGAGDKPILEVYNKTDLVSDADKGLFPGNALEISAATGTGIEALLDKLEETVNGGKKILKLFFSHAQAGKAAEVYRFATVHDTEYTENGTVITALCDSRAQGMFSQFVQE
ncbi:MAG: GTPase HflX [Clostridia bacterium]|nr:GTPase HflX [Clostridia bacterium]MBR4053445.1 GTPase HflX [Clostridia bacterium]